MDRYGIHIWVRLYAFNPGDCNSWVGTAQKEHTVRFPGKVIPIRFYFDDWSSVFMREVSCECVSPTDCTDTNLWGCHNCSCGTRACSPHDVARELGLFQPRVVEVRIDDLNPYSDSQNARQLLRGCPQHLLYMQLRSLRGMVILYCASFYSGLLSRNVNVVGHTLRYVLYLYINELKNNWKMWNVLIIWVAC